MNNAKFGITALVLSLGLALVVLLPSAFGAFIGTYPPVFQDGVLEVHPDLQYDAGPRTIETSDLRSGIADNTCQNGSCVRSFEVRRIISPETIDISINRDSGVIPEAARPYIAYDVTDAADDDEGTSCTDVISAPGQSSDVRAPIRNANECRTLEILTDDYILLEMRYRIYDSGQFNSPAPSPTRDFLISFGDPPRDEEPPMIEQPANIIIVATGENTIVPISPPLVTDNQGTAPPIMRNDTRDAFPIGTHVIRWFAEDTAGNPAEVFQTITVSADNIPPTITAPSDVSLVAKNWRTIPTDTELRRSEITTSDNSDGVIVVTNDIPDPPGGLSVGVHTVNWTATDPSGNFAIDTQQVTITALPAAQDTIPPNIEAPADIRLVFTRPYTEADLGTPALSDNSGVRPTASSDINSSPDTTIDAAGTYTITWTATDRNGNTNTATQQVVLEEPREVEPPEISNVADQIIYVSPDDNFPLTRGDLVFNTDHAIYLGFVTGNPSDADLQLRTEPLIRDPPPCDEGDVQCPAIFSDNANIDDLFVGDDFEYCFDIAIWAVPGEGAEHNQLLDTIRVSLLPVGSPKTSGTCAYDEAPTITADFTTTRFPGSAEFTPIDLEIDITDIETSSTDPITITDAEKITEDIDLTLNIGSIGTITINDDSCGPGIDCYIEVTNDAPADGFRVGFNIVTWTVTDVGGRTATATQLVQIANEDGPTVTAPDDITVFADEGVQLTSVDIGVATVTDLFGAEYRLGVNLVNDAPTEGFLAGRTVVTWTAIDEDGEESIDTQTIIVIPETLKVILDEQSIAPSTGLKINYTIGDKDTRLIVYNITDAHGTDITDVDISTDNSSEFSYTVSGNITSQKDSSLYQVVKNIDDCDEDDLGVNDHDCAYFELVPSSSIGERRIADGTAEHCFVLGLKATDLSTETDPFSDFVNTIISIVPEDSDTVFETCEPSRGGGDNDDDWKKRPTFGISDHTQTQLVSCGYSMDGTCTDVLDYHVDYKRQIIYTNSSHDFALKTYTPVGIRMMTIVFGLPSIGAPLADAEASIDVTVKPNYSGDYPYDIVDVKIHDIGNTIDYDPKNTKVSLADCKEDLAATCVLFEFNGVLFREQFFSEPFAMSAIDLDGRTRTHYMNEGLLIQGESLNPAPVKVGGFYKQGNQYSGYTLELERIDKLEDIWQDQVGNLWTKNDWSTWEQLTFPDIENGPDGDTKVMTRIHSEFDSMIESEINRAVIVFDSNQLQNEIGEFFAYTMPERFDRAVDPELLERLYIEEQKAIAKLPPLILLDED